MISTKLKVFCKAASKLDKGYFTKLCIDEIGSFFSGKMNWARHHPYTYGDRNHLLNYYTDMLIRYYGNCIDNTRSLTFGDDERAQIAKTLGKKVE